MKLRNRITIPTVTIGLLLLTLGVSGAWYVLRLQRLNSQILDVNVSSIRAAEEIEIHVREMRHELDRFLLNHNLARLVRASEKEKDVDAWLQLAREYAESEEKKALLSEIQAGLDEFFLQVRQVIDGGGETAPTEIVGDLVDDLLTQRVLAPARQYLDINEHELQASNQQNKAMAERLALALLLLGTCGAIAGLVAGFGVARGISRSIFQLNVPIRDVAGKLNEVVGPIEISADPSVEDLESMLQQVSTKVGAVVEQLHARHRELIRSDQLAAVGQLAAGLAHELRNPLMCMKTLVQSARRQDRIASFDSRDLSVLDEEISRLEKLVQGFLDFARPAKPDKEDVDLLPLIRQTVSLLSGRAAARSVTIDCDLPPDPLVLQVDATQLRQVLLNLLLNALDAVRNDGRIWVRAGYDEIERQPNGAAETTSQLSIRLQVLDDGRGLPGRDRTRIYEPFFSTKETGLGLGLAISHRIVESHGGQILAYDREGGGTIFEIVLPAQEAFTGSPA
ncbi:MAG: ATP-binding protein [Pirellulales bacterium]